MLPLTLVEKQNDDKNNNFLRGTKSFCSMIGADWGFSESHILLEAQKISFRACDPGFEKAMTS
jgi:hypothetical protein